MSGKVRKTIALLLAVMLLAGVPSLTACGDDDGNGGGGEIVMGVLADFTGPAALAVKHYIDGAMAYVRYVEDNPEVLGWPSGVKIRTVNYDQRTDPGRVKPGYKWLKGQGIQVIFVVSPTDLDILEDDLIADQIPSVGSHFPELNPSAAYSYALWASQHMQAESELMYIMNNWDYTGEGRPPKVGHQTWTLPSGHWFQEGLDVVLDMYPDKFDFVGVEYTPVGTSTWASQIAKFKDCDYISVTLVGTTMSTFVTEARDRGYTGQFITGTTGFPGYFELVIDSAAQADLYGFNFVMACPFYNDDYDWIPEMVSTFQADTGVTMKNLLEGNTGPIGGWLTAIFAMDAMKRAVNAVGVENVTGKDVKEALDATDLFVEGASPVKNAQGVEGVWTFREDYHAVCRAYRAYNFDNTAMEWKVDPDAGWIVPPDLVDYQ